MNPVEFYYFYLISVRVLSLLVAKIFVPHHESCPMKILVPIKRAIDYTVKIRVKSDLSGVEQNNVKMSINPFDEIAVEEAVRLKEQGKASEIIVVTIGPAAAQDVVRSAMAMGADRGILIETALAIDLGGIEPLMVAKLLKIMIEKESPNLVIMGKQAIDDDSNQTAQMLSALVNWPLASYASQLTCLDGGLIEVAREIDGGAERVRLSLPAIVSADLRLNTPRYAALPNIMKARQKPLATLKAEELGVDLSSKLKLIKVQEPPPRAGGMMVASTDELIEKLRHRGSIT